MKIPALVATSTLILALAACSNEADSTPQPSPQANSAESQSTDESQSDPEISPRGFVIKEIGEPAYYGTSESLTPETADFKFILNNIGVDSMCANDFGAVVQGQPVQLDISVETRDFGPESQAIAATMFSHANWKWLREDGTTEGVNQQPTEGNLAFYCSERASFLDPMAPNSKYEGSMWLDVPLDASALMLTSQNGGWEWSLPA